MDKKFFLMRLVDQLEEEKVDSLIDVVKGMVCPTDITTGSIENTTEFHPTMTANDNGEQIVTQNINDIFK